MDSEKAYPAKLSCLACQKTEIANKKNLEQTDFIIIDFTKAFDIVDPSLLVKSLEHYGLNGWVKSWIENFLAGRSQSAVVEGSKFKQTKVRSRVPQGSVLGPCLFLVYINDLTGKVSTNNRLFADDTAIDSTKRTLWPRNLQTRVTDKYLLNSIAHLKSHMMTHLESNKILAQNSMDSENGYPAKPSCLACQRK